jgi:exopolysaccharide biosynthesis polyprenyl glycosylphosphotransferase
MRRIAAYPGVRPASAILPAVGACYSVLICALLVFRLEYSVAVLASGFFGILAARYALASLHSRSDDYTFFVVPGGRAKRMRDLHGLKQDLLLSPQIPQVRNPAIIADLHHDHTPEWERFFAEASIAGIPVYHHKQIYEATTGMVRIEHLSENGFGSLVPGLFFAKIKRMVDVLVALVALFILVPATLVIALAIKLDSPGPVFFRQRRMGYRGKPFMMIKFRTMTVANSEGARDAAVTHSDDARITRLGRFMRRTRIDELPQVLNILLGQMSWIGPRPEAIGLSQWYEKEIPFYRYRHIVRPGITGWAQVNQGHVSSIQDVDTKLQLDFYYIKNFSYWIDLLVVFRTLKVVLTGFGSR